MGVYSELQTKELINGELGIGHHELDFETTLDLSGWDLACHFQSQSNKDFHKD